MSHYKHLSIEEREKILVLRTEKKNLHQIARELKRSVSTISRELKRNTKPKEKYSAVKAQSRYRTRRRKCRRHKLLDNRQLKDIVARLFLEQQWSPEEISNRLILEGNPYRISATTIYRAIYQGVFDPENPVDAFGYRGVKRMLRHHGKPRKDKSKPDRRGQVPVLHRIADRPKEAQERSEIGHWEVDTVLGKLGGACLVTMPDRKSRYLLAGKVGKKQSPLVADTMIALLLSIPKDSVKTLTPDRGREFTHHEKVTDALDGVPFYFADPHAPWQRGTNENTNGLLREYFPKSCDFDAYSDEEIAAVVDKLNHRPRKCLGWKSPFEVFFHKVLHLT